MRPRRFLIDHGDRIALAAILPLCIMAIVSGVGEIRRPQAPPAGLEAAYGAIRRHLDRDTTDYAALRRVPEADEKVAASYEPATNGILLAKLPGRIAYDTPPWPVKRPRPPVGPEVVPVLARWGLPSALVAQADLGRVELSWGPDLTAEHVAPLRWEVERRKAGDADWERIAVVEIAPDETAFSYIDTDVEPKTTYAYRVRGVATGNPPADTKEKKCVLIKPDGLMAEGEEAVEVGGETVTRQLWTGFFTGAVSATTPRNIRMYLAGFVGAGAGRQARIRVIRHEGGGAWANFEAASAVNDVVRGERDVRRSMADGSVRWVTERLDTGTRLVEIIDRFEKVPVKMWVIRIDPATGRTYRKKEVHYKVVKVQKLKLVDVDTGEVVWAPSVRDAELPGAAAVASAPAHAPRTRSTTRPTGRSLIRRGPERKPPVAAPRGGRDDRPGPPEAVSGGQGAGDGGMTEEDREAIDGPHHEWEGETR